MPRTVLMGDPTYFSVLGGANPHTRNALGIRKSVNADRARAQWHGLARALIAHGTEVCVVEPHQGMSGLVYPANAGFLYPLDGVPGLAVRDDRERLERGARQLLRLADLHAPDEARVGRGRA
ncbi:MAG: hypothetical protein ACXWML_10880, partial [Candidatus Binataceae bacterium]